LESLNNIQKKVLDNTDVHQRTLISLFPIGHLQMPIPEQKYDLRLYLAQTPIGHGCSYSETKTFDYNLLHNLLGQDTKRVLEDEKVECAIKISILDSMYGSLFPILKKNIISKSFDGSLSQKNDWRTGIVLHEVKRLIGKSNASHTLKVLNIGVVASFLKTLINAGYNVIGSDFNKTIIEGELTGIRIEDGEKSPYLIKDADLVIATGMTIATKTLDKIIQECRKHNVKLIVFAETGHSFASYYLNEGVDVFLSEHFPFYSFMGHSKIDICRKNK
jgi:hypothetical protein